MALVLHFVADFVCQTNTMALNKSTWCVRNWRDGWVPYGPGIKALLSHTALYSVCFLVLGLPFVLITFTTHTLTDAITSKITSLLWFIDFVERPEREKNDFGEFDRFGAYPLYARVKDSRHWFFVVIGLDQLIHTLTLIGTLVWLKIV